MGGKTDKTIQIADTIHGSIRLNTIEKQIISTPIFNRLHNISQNSTAYLTFPTNRTKRFEHSIGTMQLCGDMFISSIANSDDEALDEFFQSIDDIITNQISKTLEKYDSYRNKIGDRNFSPEKIIKYKEIKINKEYNNFIPINVKDKYRTLHIILFQAIRLSALLHDVGHPPYSHITEFALKDIWNELKSIEDKNKRQKEFISIMEIYFNSKSDLHEQIGNKITDKVMKSIIEAITEAQARDKELFEKQLFKVIVSEITSAILEEKATIFSDMHRIIDGTIDGDRLDYVSRDLLNSGLNVGCIEYDRIIEGMRLVKEGENFLFIPSTKNIDSIEDFFNRRWKLYKQIVYHHRVIKTDYLLQECIKELARSYLNNDDESINKNSTIENSKILDYDISSIWKAIEDKISRSHFFDRLIQWDDGWLMAIMKKHYFDEYSEDSDNILTYKLEELLANKKYYYSLIKRTEDFICIDKAVAKTMKNEYASISALVEENEKPSKEGCGQIVINLDTLFKYVSDLENVINRYDNNESSMPTDGFILRKINKIYDNMFYEDWLSDIILECVENIKKHPQYSIKDVFACIKKAKVGVKGGKNAKQGGLGIYTTNDGKIEAKSFLELSNVGKSLTMESNFMPVFYLYVYKNNENEFKDYDKIKEDLGTMIGEKIAEKVKNKLSELINN